MTIKSLDDLLVPGAALAGLKTNSKKHLLQQLSQRMAQLHGLDERAIYETIQERERLGSTGFGGGVAIPHGRLAGLKHVTALFARLDAPIDFDALDHQPVDLVCLLLAPLDAGADHLKALARVSRTFRDTALVEKLRGARNDDALYALLAGQERKAA